MTDITVDANTLTFLEIIPLINTKYIELLHLLHRKYKHHEELYESIENDIQSINDKFVDHEYPVLNIITDNFLFCLEQIYDQNADYFIYQKEKIRKKNGKVYKNKLPKIGSKTLLKSILEELEGDTQEIIFKTI